jgi:hypothetical protein
MGGSRFAEKFSGLLGEERRFGGLNYPYYLPAISGYAEN